MAMTTFPPASGGTSAPQATAPGPLAIAGVASMAAGAIHAVAVGSHAAEPQASRAFAVLAALQLGWGALALVGRHRAIAVAGLAIHAVAIGGWVLAKTSGIPLIDGLGDTEDLQRADVLAVALATVAVVVALRAIVSGSRTWAPGRPVLGVAVVALGAVSLLGMDSTTTHNHVGSDTHDGQAEMATGTSAADGHHGAKAAGAKAAGAETAGGAKAAGAETAGGHGEHGTPAAVATTPYDPTKPIDLSGVAGVSPEQQARAENMVAITLARLPRYSDYKAAEADGYHTINDGGTGHEHFINWSYINDDQTLNPDVPEALVYETGPGGSRTLVAAMFMLGTGTTLDDTPDIGGALTQWHIHDDLCFSDDPVAPIVAGVTKVGGSCRPPLVKLDPVPMIHVWITKHQCGPFSALEGIGAGQVEEGETKACDEVHGA